MPTISIWDLFSVKKALYGFHYFSARLANVRNARVFHAMQTLASLASIPSLEKESL